MNKNVTVDGVTLTPNMLHEIAIWTNQHSYLTNTLMDRMLISLRSVQHLLIEVSDESLVDFEKETLAALRDISKIINHLKHFASPKTGESNNPL